MKLRTALIAMVGVLLILIAYRLFVPHQPSVSDTMPFHLLGTWVTNAQHYSDRYVKIDTDAITFGTGGVTGRRYVVTAFNQQYEDDGELLNTVYFKDVDGSRLSRQFYFRPENRGQIVFKNQPQILWIRQPPPVNPEDQLQERTGHGDDSRDEAGDETGSEAES